MGAPALPVTDRTCSWCVHDLPSGAPSGPAGVGDPWAPSPHSRRPWGGIAQTTEPWGRASDGYQLTRERLAPSNSGLRAARDEDVEASDDGGLEESTGLRREHVEADEIVQVVGLDDELADIDVPVLPGDVGNDNVKSTPGELSVTGAGLGVRFVRSGTSVRLRPTPWPVLASAGQTPMATTGQNS